MKKHPISILTALTIGAALFMSACLKEDEFLWSQADDQMGASADALSFPASTISSTLTLDPRSDPFGKTFRQWTVEYWKYVMSFACEINPLLDDSGDHVIRDQEGPVIFLSSVTGGIASREVTVPADAAMLFPVLSVLAGYPCTDALGKPAPGQTVESFLQAGTKSFIDKARNLRVTLDGMEIPVTPVARAASNIFYLTGHPELAKCLDPCITGFAQPAVSDGYWIMLNTLRPGKHKLHFHAEVPEYGYVVDVTYLIIAI